jgi:hypothetical protein
MHKTYCIPVYQQEAEEEFVPRRQIFSDPFFCRMAPLSNPKGSFPICRIPLERNPTDRIGKGSGGTKKAAQNKILKQILFTQPKRRLTRQSLDSAAGKKLVSLGHTHTPNTQNFFSTYQLFPFSTKEATLYVPYVPMCFKKKTGGEAHAIAFAIVFVS